MSSSRARRLDEDVLEFDVPASCDATDPSPDECRDLFSSVVISARGRSSGKHFHIPHWSSTADDPLPLCAYVGKEVDANKGWRHKSMSVYPPGWWDWCQICRSIYCAAPESVQTAVEG